MGKLSEVTRLGVLALTLYPLQTDMAQQDGHTPESRPTSTSPSTAPGQVNAPTAPAAQPTPPHRRRWWRPRTANPAPPTNTQPDTQQQCTQQQCTQQQSAEELQRQRDAALLKQQEADSARQQWEQEQEVRQRAQLIE